MNYHKFLQQKRMVVTPKGLHVPRERISETLFDFQREIVPWALQRGNAAIWADCGLGKTPMQLEWAKHVEQHTSKPVLILAPLAVSQQTKREGEKFGIEVTVCKSQQDVGKRGIVVTNYERLDKFDFSAFGGLVLDESSILKNYVGKIKNSIVKRSAGIPYKLSCTATPAPNDHTEILNHGEFLGIMKSGFALTLWFTNDTTKANNLRLKHHAQDAFWQWVSSWAVCISSPADLGYDDSRFRLPELRVHEHQLPISEFNFERGDGCFLRDVQMSATAYNREKKHTMKPRCEKTAEIVHSTDGQIVVWVERNYEADYLKQLLPDAVEIRGNDSVDAKQQAAIDFVNGDIRVLISKPSIFGYGLNFQNCHQSIFCGLSFSYENYYQAVRRFWRFGQTKPVDIHVVYGDSEKRVLEIVREKEERHLEMQAAMFGKLKEIQYANLRGVEYKLSYDKNIIMQLPGFLRKAA